MKNLKCNSVQTRQPTESYGEIEKRAAEQNIPLYAHLELTNTCNVNCVHCYLTHGSQKKELSTDEIKQVIDQLAELGTLYLSLTGGEILCRHDFFEIAGYARKKGFALRLFTNATLVTPEIAKKIQNLCPLFVEISLYGMSPDVHDSITKVSGSLSRTIYGIHLLRDQGINLLIKTPVMKSNFTEVAAVKNFADKIGAIFRADPVITPKLDGALEPTELRLSDDELAWLNREINIDWNLHEPEPEAPLCNAGKGVLAINPYGEVFPCVRIGQKAGDLNEKSLQTIWNNSDIMKNIRELTLTKLKICSKCTDINYCNPCPGLALLEHGDITQPAEECCRQANSKKVYQL